MSKLGICQSPHYIWSLSDGTLLGDGTFGKVHKGHKKETGEFVAVKVLKYRAKETREQYTQRVMKEWVIVDGIQDEHIVRYEEKEEFTCLADKTTYLIFVMELADGTLRDELNNPEHYYGLPYEALFAIINDCVNAFQYLHVKEIAHRDMKPDNVLIFKKPRLTCKLCDFGGARFLKKDERTAEIVGSPNYLNSAIANNLVNRTRLRGYSKDEHDMWACSVCFFECATGRLPFIVKHGNLHRLLDPREQADPLTSKCKGPVVCGERIRAPNSTDDENVYHYGMPLQHYSYSRSLKNILTQFFKRVFAKDKSYLKFDVFHGLCRELISLKSCKFYNVSELSIDEYFDTTQSGRFIGKTFCQEVLGENRQQDEVVEIMQGISAYSDATPFQPTYEQNLDKLVVWKSKFPGIMVHSLPDFSALMLPLNATDLKDAADIKNASGKIIQMQMQDRQIRIFYNTILSFCHTCKQATMLRCYGSPEAKKILESVMSRFSAPGARNDYEMQQEPPEGLQEHDFMEVETMSVPSVAYNDAPVTYTTLKGGKAVSGLERSSLRSRDVTNVQEEVNDRMTEADDLFKVNCKLVAKEYREAQDLLKNTTQRVFNAINDVLSVEIQIFHEVVKRLHDQQLPNPNPQA